MSILEALLLGLLQGVAEFLPISSSGHLALVQKLFSLEEIPLLFDVLLHVATLFAVVLVFYKQIAYLFVSFGRFLVKKNTEDDTENLKIIWALFIATFITGVFGIIFSKIIPDLPIIFVYCGFIVTSFLLLYSTYVSNKKEETEGNELSIKKGAFIGLAQGIGVLPGISRSGITISAALLVGVSRKTAGEFSFLLSIPAILGALVLELKDFGTLATMISWQPLVVGCFAAFASGFFALKFLLKLIQKGKLSYFAYYLIPLALIGMIFFR
ncbi:MAG: undecaprenyl-diphosphate phosphatase [Spirochaetaceae bacterium]|nr:undecaprenyl-diphosphate phosphatase [Spirochaetaceae bacterium]